MKILFCMATGNNAVNINPLAEINPEKVLVLITQSMQESAKTLLDEIKSSGFKAEAVRIDNESSLKSLNEQFSTLIEDNIDDELIANITGGTKLMSMSLYQLFSSWGFRSFYCDKDQSKLIWLDDESVISNIGSKIGLKQYLRVHQAQIKNNLTLVSIDKSQKNYANALYQELCSPARYEMICQMIGKIHAHTAQNSLALNNFSFKNDELAIVKELQKTGLFHLDNGVIICNNTDNKKFMNGAWLEFLVADRLRGNNCRDIMLSVETIQSTKRVGSETRQYILAMAKHCQISVNITVYQNTLSEYLNNPIQANPQYPTLHLLSNVVDIPALQNSLLALSRHINMQQGKQIICAVSPYNYGFGLLRQGLYDFFCAG